MASLLGSEVGPYRILRLVGKGGMGEVYAGRFNYTRPTSSTATSPPADTIDPQLVIKRSGGLTPTAIVSLGLSLFLGVGLGFWWGRRRR